ncbi:alpha-galactosidase [Streptomyces sp. ST2-7A]|uniref:alpha-galactosidase n=1 Tax=Streptomyces sp. ST2-7A TaxID=2907214 RepID=UPI001F1F46E9|nr:alpha-galactosidase [Streptomyces sp. ST2-7A]MCE7083093.1 alpha-galactosidase [Streptomyces sp. ST2-7A]
MTPSPSPRPLPPAAPSADGIVVLRADGVGLVLDTGGGTLPRVLHWGADPGPLDPADAVALRLALRPQAIGFSTDEAVEVSVLPEQSAGWLGTPGLIGHRAGGTDFSTAFRTRSIDVESGTAEGEGGGTVTVRAGDPVAELDLELTVELTPQGVVRQRAVLTNTARSPFTLEALHLVLPVPAEAVELLDFTGHHLRERGPQRTAFTHGLRTRENRTGRTGYDSVHLLAAGTAGFGNRSGEIHAIHTAWSGNHRTFAERTFHSISLLGSGELLLSGEGILEPGGSYTTPWRFASYGIGLDEVSDRLHRWMRARPHHPSRPRPVVVNTWEAVYFDHDLDRLTALADAAAGIGAERFVLDDGWFGGRRDDRRALGDWYVSEEVWPDGLGPLIDHVTGLGMEFGLWVEPEMVNEDSDLARAHPDWIMSTAGRLPGPARHQQVLDLTRPEAFDHILGRLDALLTDHPIAYLKWDHNRDLVEAGRPPTGRAGTHAQTLAVYRLMDEVRRRHPDLEIESCSSGGGRVDLGILERADRVWTSDCIDALERQGIQRWTNALIPLELMGTHVGAELCHTTDRRHPLDFRAGTALFGHFGVEWDLTAASPAERERLAEWVALFKENRDLLHTGTAVHADLPDPAFRLHGVVARDGSRALYSLVALASSEQYPPGPVRLPGLDPAVRYRVRPQPPGDVPDGNAARWGKPLPWWTPEGVVLSGRTLERVGVRAPVLFPERLVLLRADRVGDGES